MESTTEVRVALKRRERRKARLMKAGKIALVTAAFGAIGLLGRSSVDFPRSKPSRSVKTANAIQASSRKAPRTIAAVSGTSLQLVTPAAQSDIIAIGYHEAENPLARRLDPTVPYLSDETTTSVQKQYKLRKFPVSFVMYTRQRGTDPRSSIDVAMKPNSTLRSPVTGTVTKIKEYVLYEEYSDYHIEIQPDGYPELRVAIIHIDKLSVQVGSRVIAGETPLAVQRAFPGLDTQINQYLPTPLDHVHIQVNPYVPDSEAVAQ
ncbi:MAG: hypothetical protein ACYC1U_00570 [Candidatus Aquicultorales bacterium]